MAKLDVVALLRLPDGREFEVHHQTDEQYSDIELFYWTEGNASCDCNRSLYLNREHDLNLVDPIEGECLSCGDTITLISLHVGGVKIYG